MVRFLIIFPVVFVCTESKVDPLLAFAFIQTFVDILQEYFGTVSVPTVKENFDIVYQVRNLSACSCSMVYKLEAPGRNFGFGRIPINHIAQCSQRYCATSFPLQQVPKCCWFQFQYEDQSRFYWRFLITYIMAKIGTTICKQRDLC